MNFDEQMLDMLQHQIVARGIKNPRILEAMQRVPRHLFVPEELKGESYADKPLALPEDRATISQPYMVAYMSEALNCMPTDRILEIGTGSGFQAAVLSHLCAQVYTIERHYSLSVNAQRTIHNLGIANISFKIGDGFEGWAEHAPFDKIIVTAAARQIPPLLLEQLASNGMMIIPLGESQMQKLTLIRKQEDDQLYMRSLIPCVFVPLISNYRDLTQTDDPHDKRQV